MPVLNAKVRAFNSFVPSSKSQRVLFPGGCLELARMANTDSLRKVGRRQRGFPWHRAAQSPGTGIFQPSQVRQSPTLQGTAASVLGNWVRSEQPVHPSSSCGILPDVHQSTATVLPVLGGMATAMPCPKGCRIGAANHDLLPCAQALAWGRGSQWSLGWHKEGRSGRAQVPGSRRRG